MLQFAGRNAWRKIHDLVHSGTPLTEALSKLRHDHLFWQREVYEYCSSAPRTAVKGLVLPRGKPWTQVWQTQWDKPAKGGKDRGRKGARPAPKGGKGKSQKGKGQAPARAAAADPTIAQSVKGVGCATRPRTSAPQMNAPMPPSDARLVQVPVALLHLRPLRYRKWTFTGRLGMVQVPWALYPLHHLPVNQSLDPLLGAQRGHLYAHWRNGFLPKTGWAPAGAGGTGLHLDDRHPGQIAAASSLDAGPTSTRGQTNHSSTLCRKG